MQCGKKGFHASVYACISLQSFILGLVITAFDCRKGDVLHQINMYGFFSTLSCTTNVFLALRVMYHDRPWMKVGLDQQPSISPNTNVFGDRGSV